MINKMSTIKSGYNLQNKSSKSVKALKIIKVKVLGLAHPLGPLQLSQHGIKHNQV